MPLLSLSIPSLSGRYHVEQCQDIFNISAKTLYAGIDQTNENYGSYNIRATRIVFPNGSIDPWHALGITSSISDDLPAIFIKGEGSTLVRSIIQLMSMVSCDYIQVLSISDKCFVQDDIKRAAVSCHCITAISIIYIYLTHSDPGTAHCANMYPARAEDLPQLTLAREHVFQLLQKWLKEK